MKRRYIEITINEFNGLLFQNHSFFNNFIFRGQGDKEWPLETALCRMVKSYHQGVFPKNACNIYEKAMIDEFKWKYPVYQSNPNMMPSAEESIEWLSVMQHYGTKTRMLDFTDSMFVALFMAIDGANNSDAALWAINKNMIREPFKKSYEADGAKLSFEDVDTIMYEEAQDWLNKKILNDGDYDYKRLYIVRPRICNERISRQQGLFVLPSTLSLPFERVLHEYCDMDNVLVSDIGQFENNINMPGEENNIGVIKIIIPNAVRYDAVRALQMMNISTETMYPGLEGLAQSVNRLRKLSYEYSEGNTPKI